LAHQVNAHVAIYWAMLINIERRKEGGLRPYQYQKTVVVV